jgi:hypothetical protein
MFYFLIGIIGTIIIMSLLYVTGVVLSLGKQTGITESIVIAITAIVILAISITAFCSIGKGVVLLYNLYL